jgi:bifunctional non-homologous end joining protein LigD
MHVSPRILGGRLEWARTKSRRCSGRRPKDGVVATEGRFADARAPSYDECSMATRPRAPIEPAGRSRLPVYKPQLATLAHAAPSGTEWAHEFKWDGWRCGARIASGRVRLESRQANDLSGRFPTIREAAEKLPLKAAVLDGEIVVLMPNGLANFQALQTAKPKLPLGAVLAYLVFDVLHLDGEDVSRFPLEERKTLLLERVGLAERKGVIRYVPHIVGDGPQVHERACALGVEGIVSKKRRAPHTAGRSRSWLKVKCARVEPLVVGGFTEGDGVSALLVGYYDESGRFVFAGSVGTGRGFTREFLRGLRAQLARIEQSDSPFVGFSPKAIRSPWGQRRSSTPRWVQPLLVVQVAITEWTDDGGLRHPSFRGFSDQRAETVIRATGHRTRTPVR